MQKKEPKIEYITTKDGTKYPTNETVANLLEYIKELKNEIEIIKKLF